MPMAFAKAVVSITCLVCGILGGVMPTSMYLFVSVKHSVVDLLFTPLPLALCLEML